MRYKIVFLSFILLTAISFAQVSDKISKVNIGVVKDGEPLTIQVDLVQSTIVDRVEIAHRRFGERDFKRNDMSVAGSIASIVLPAEVISPPFLEYYFVVWINGRVSPETYPIENAEQNPLKLSVNGVNDVKKELIVLSPEKGENTSQDDLLISFSVSQYDSSLDRTSIQIYLDDINLSKNVISSGDLFIVRPSNASIFLESGKHDIRIELFDTLHKPMETFSWNFLVTNITVQKTSFATSPWRYGGSFQGETRQENIADRSTPYNRITFSAFGNYNEFQVKGNLYLTNEDKKTVQPQNRFFIGGESPWAKIGYGDCYPVFPDLIMNGKRLRGFIGSLSLGKFNFDIAFGNITRKIEGIVYETFSRDQLVSEQNDALKQYQYPGASIDSLKSLGSWARLRYGTYDRKLFVVRPMIGKRDGSHIAFSYLKSTDDINSIKYGIRPQENLVVGSDILLSFDNRNIEVNGQAAFSATNKDISGGSFSDQEIDSTFEESQRQTVRQIRDYVSKMITVNENLVPLGMKNLPTLSYETGLALNYFNNNFHFQYMRHGESYESFGQSYLRTDVAGFNISDRQRLIDNRLILSLGFENLKDNTARTKASTTSSLTANFGISYLPRTDMPNISAGFLTASNENNRQINDSLYAIDDRTNRFLIQFAKEFEWGMRHNAALNISTSTRNDKTIKNLDTRNTNVALTDILAWSIPMQITLSLSVSTSRFISFNRTYTALSYTNIYTSGQYRLLADRLRLTASFNPTFGDVQRILIGAGAQYYFSNNLSAQTQLNAYFNKKMYNYSSTDYDIVWNLILRADI